MKIPNNIIVNADDFGINSKINKAIVQCFNLGIINSTSIMTNISGFEEAIYLSRVNGFQNNIGLHANLTEGKSITELSKTKFVNSNGIFLRKHVDKFYVGTSYKVRKLIKAEIEAQLHILYDNNITPTHINSHHHIHTLPWLAGLFIEIAEKFKIKIRIAQTSNKNSNILIPVYRNILNRIYKKKKLNFTEYFETLDSCSKALEKAKKDQSLVEIMVHPDLNAQNDIFDSYDRKILKKEIEKLFQ